MEKVQPKKRRYTTHIVTARELHRLVDKMNWRIWEINRQIKKLEDHPIMEFFTPTSQSGKKELEELISLGEYIAELRKGM